MTTERYGYFVLDGSIVAPVPMCSRFGDDANGDGGVGGWQLLTDEQRTAYDWYPCDVVNESYDSRHQVRTGPLNTFDKVAQRITCTYTLTEIPIDVIKAQADKQLAEYRLTIEEGGAQMPGGGIVLTSRADQAQLNSVYSTLKTGLVSTIDWKSPMGWISATLADVEPLARISAIHVQSCFSAERRASQRYQAAQTMEELLAINIIADFHAFLDELKAAAYPPATTPVDPEPDASA
ncbi:hypothetical protein AB4P95_29935 (plasmid) [Pseudomonas sp. A1437]|uniref:DUF4376 domain-containing protein n=1 Tax=Pseudomonas sp. A1437 TaxID=3235107 RepID=UPI0037848FDF